MNAHPFANKFRVFVKLAKLGFVAIPLLLLAVVFSARSPMPQLCIVLAILCILPCFVYGYVLTILHWKARYKGNRSDLWGTLLLLETSGWFKIVYLFRHILPDLKGRGRYATPNANI